MKNKAKCKQCQSIIESLTPQDFQLCTCKEIFVDGGDSMLCGANDWSNFIRIDDNGNEIIPKIVDKTTEKTDNTISLSEQDLPKFTKEDKLDMLKEMIAGYDKLPPGALSQPITHYDMMSSLIIIHQILKEL